MESIAIHGSYLVQIKSQTYQVKVNASTVDPVLYNLKPGVAVFSVNSLTSDIPLRTIMWSVAIGDIKSS